MKIGFVTQWYEPEGASAAHPTAIARALAARGHDIEVVTGFPNYPHGKVYDGYRMGLRAQQEIRDGIRVNRVPLFPSHDASATRRAATYASYALSSLRSMPQLSRCETVLVYASPVTAALAAVALERWRGIPYVLYVQDLWPESVIESGLIKSPAGTRMVEVLSNRACDLLYKSASGVMTIAPRMRERIIGRGIPSERVQVVYNWIDEEIFQAADPDPEITRLVPPDTQLTVMYAGAMGGLQNLETAVHALADVRGEKIHLILVGDGSTRQRLIELGAQLGVDGHMTVLPPRPIDAMADTLASADVQLISLKDLPFLHMTIPSKVQACMSVGKPMVCAAIGDAADLVRSANCGIVTSPGDHHAMASAWRRMSGMTQAERKALGGNGRRYYQAWLGRERGTSLVEAQLRNAIGRRG